MLTIEEKLSQSKGELAGQQTSTNGKSDKRMKGIAERQNFSYAGQLIQTEMAVYNFYNHAAIWHWKKQK